MSGADEEQIDKAFGLVTFNVPLVVASHQIRSIKHYTVGFDGTMNDRTRVPDGEQATITAKITTMLDGNYSAGPGMQDPTYVNYLDGLFGYCSAAIAEKAADGLLEQVEKWLEADPNTEIRVFVTGFSRGAAIARHFMNRVELRSDASPASRGHIYFYAMLFDTVSTGQLDNLDLSIPPSLDYMVHFVALDESRLLFKPVVDVDPSVITKVINVNGFPIPERINQVVLPGAHSDIGGAYATGISGMYQQLSEQLLSKMGLIQQDCWDANNGTELGKHDSRGFIDRLAGTVGPNSTSQRTRLAFGIPYQQLSRDRAEENAARLRTMAFANAERGFLIQRSNSNLQLPLLTVLRSGENLAVVASDKSPYIDASSFSYTKSPRQLQFRHVPPYDTRPYSILLPDLIWNRIPNNTPTTLEHRILIHEGKQTLSTFIEDVYVTSNKTFPIPKTTGKVAGSCRRGPDGMPRKTITSMIISSGDGL